MALTTDAAHGLRVAIGSPPRLRGEVCRFGGLHGDCRRACHWSRMSRVVAAKAGCDE